MGTFPVLAIMECTFQNLLGLLEFVVTVDDFNAHNKCLTAKILKQGYRYYKLRKDFSLLYRRHHELVSKFNVCLNISLTSRSNGTRILL